MYMKHTINIILIILLVMAVSFSVVAQDVSRTPRINLNGVLGENTIGQVGILYPFVNKEDSLWFTDFRYRIGSDEISEWNLGVGYRKKLEKYDNTIAGGYLFKDSRNEYDYNWNMWTVGGELLTDEWDYRANAYITNNESVAIPENDEIIIKNQKLYYKEGFLTSMNGYDLEVGKRFVDRDDWLKNIGVYLKYYSFFNENTDTMSGQQIRIDKQFGDRDKINWELGAKWKNDNIRGSETKATFAVSIPFGKGKVKEEKDIKTKEEILETRMTEQPERDLDIVVVESDDPDLKPAKNLDGSSLGNVIYVSADGTGDGSSEAKPTNVTDLDTLSKEDDVIIFMGDDGTITAGYTLKNGQKLLSAAGKVVLSSENLDKKVVFTPDVKQAVLDNGPNDVLVLADNTMVSGIHFNDGDNIISGSDVSGKVIITDNKFIKADNRAIYLDSSGTAGINAEIKDNIIGPENGGSFSNGGIYIVNNGEGDTNLVLSGNTLQRINYNAFQIDNSASGAEIPEINIDINNNRFYLIDDYGVAIYPDNPGTINLSNNVFSTSEDSALDLYIESSDVKFKAVNNELKNIGDSGFDIYADGANNEFIIKDNKAYSINDEVFELDLENADNGILIISNNQMETGSYSGIYLDDFDGSNLELRITENIIKSMDDYGIYLSDPDVSDCNINISNNIISGTGDNALYLDFDGDNNTFKINNNQITDSDYGIEVDLDGDVYYLEINNNTISSIREDEGIYVDLDGNNGEATIDNNIIFSVVDDYGLDVEIDGDNNSTSVSNNNVSSTYYGIEVYLNGTENELDFLSNNISKNSSETLYLYFNGSDHTVNVLNNNITKGYESDGFQISNSSSGTYFTVEKNKVTDITSYELFHISNSGADTTYDIKNNIFGNAPDDNGVYINNNTSSGIAEFNITGNTISNVEDSALEFYINGGDVIVNIENNMISDSLDYGVHIRGNSTYADEAEFMLSGNTIINNFSDGIYVDLSSVVDLGGGSLDSTGNNLIYGNAGNQVSNNSGSEIMAEDNWWNQIPDDDLFNGDVDYDPYLEEAPVN